MFIKSICNPIISRQKNSFFSLHCANPDILEYDGKVIMYFRGQGKELHDQIGIAFTEHEKFDGVNWEYYKQNPVVSVSKDRTEFDCRHILDPASVIINGKVFLYYSGHSYDKPACIGLAVSADGFTFKKIERPVIENAIAPEVVLKDGKIHLFYQRKKEGRFEFYKCTSDNGFDFNIDNEEIVMSPSNVEGPVCFSVSTCRILRDEENYYMFYGMCSKYDDYPEAFGLAKSDDLINWRSYPGNPIMKRGDIGQWDEGAIWFATVYKNDDTYYLWYEGCGAGLGTKTEEAVKASEVCRNNDYGGYAKISFSQIGMASLNGKLPVW